MMKLTKITTIVLFIVIILAPIIAFNFEEDAISSIDNRNLAANPFSPDQLNNESDLTDNIENFINDRIGFRDDMVLAYTILNDKLFNKMVHPSYVYGKDGYVFGAGLSVNNPYTEYHEAFADMVKAIQDYCDARNVPFLFVFNPAKPAVLTDYIPTGLNYDRTWVNLFLEALDKRHIRYIDNTSLLQEKTNAGEIVFNQKYDANHWNDLGAYYGTNAMLAELKKSIPTIHINSLNELNVTEKIQTSLPVSEFPINESVPSISINMDLNSDDYPTYAEELYRHPSYTGFGYYINKSRIQDGSPQALVFQGSYMNGYGYKYLANAFSKYVYVHDYQNVIDFPYYYNIFQPDCVIFEVAEYTLSNTYFSYDNMRAMDLNPILKTAIDESSKQVKHPLIESNLSIDKGDLLTIIQWETDTPADYVWLKLDQEYDMKKTENGYVVTISSQTYEENVDNLQIVTSYDDTITIFTP